MKNKRKLFINYFWIPLGIVYMIIGNDMTTHFWYDGWWSLGGEIAFIVGLFMCCGCIIIHIIIFFYGEVDNYIRKTVKDEMGKGEPNK